MVSGATGGEFGLRVRHLSDRQVSNETLIHLPNSLVIVKYYDGQRFITSFQKRYVLKQQTY